LQLAQLRDSVRVARGDAEFVQHGPPLFEGLPYFGAEHPYERAEGPSSLQRRLLCDPFVGAGVTHLEVVS
jgi:hypothetical protein